MCVYIYIYVYVYIHTCTHISTYKSETAISKITQQPEILRDDHMV